MTGFAAAGDGDGGEYEGCGSHTCHVYGRNVGFQDFKLSNQTFKALPLRVSAFELRLNFHAKLKNSYFLRRKSAVYVPPVPPVPPVFDEL